MSCNWLHRLVDCSSCFLSLAFLVADSNPSWFLTQIFHFLGLQFLTHSFRLMPCQFPTRTFPLSHSAPCQTNSFMFSGAKVRCSCCFRVSWYHPILLFIAFCLSAPQCPNLLPQEPHDSFWNLFLQVYSLRRVTVLITLHFVHFGHDDASRTQMCSIIVGESWSMFPYPLSVPKRALFCHQALSVRHALAPWTICPIQCTRLLQHFRQSCAGAGHALFHPTPSPKKLQIRHDIICSNELEQDDKRSVLSTERANSIIIYIDH